MSFDLKLENGDLKIGTRADLALVQDAEKLIQDLLKIVGTDLGANRMFPWYGSPIAQSLIGRAFDKIFIQSVGTNQLMFSINNLQRLQQEQLKNDQIVTPHEQIATIQDVLVDQNQIDPRFFNISLTVLNKAFKRFPVQFSVSP